MPDRYTVAPDGTACATCGQGQTYHIAWENEHGVDFCTGQSWSDVDEAQYICRLMNAAYAAGQGKRDA